MVAFLLLLSALRPFFLPFFGTGQNGWHLTTARTVPGKGLYYRHPRLNGTASTCAGGCYRSGI